MGHNQNALNNLGVVLTPKFLMVIKGQCQGFFKPSNTLGPGGSKWFFINCDNFFRKTQGLKLESLV